MEVKAEAFMPPVNKGITEISVYRTQGCSENEIWAIGQRYVADPGNRTLYARGDIPVKAVHHFGLGVESDPTPHARHANITKFPSDKSLAKLRAMELAKQAVLVIR